MPRTLFSGYYGARREIDPNFGGVPFTMPYRTLFNGADPGTQQELWRQRVWRHAIYQDMIERQRQKDLLDEQRQREFADGSLYFSPTQKREIARLDDALSKVQSDRRFDAAQRQQALQQLLAQRQAITPRRRPKEQKPLPIDQQLKQRVFWDGGAWGKGTPWTIDPQTGIPQIPRGYKAPEPPDPLLQTPLGQEAQKVGLTPKELFDARSELLKEKAAFIQDLKGQGIDPGEIESLVEQAFGERMQMYGMGPAATTSGQVVPQAGNGQPQGLYGLMGGQGPMRGPVQGVYGAMGGRGPSPRVEAKVPIGPGSRRTVQTAASDMPARMVPVPQDFGDAVKAGKGLNEEEFTKKFPDLGRKGYMTYLKTRLYVMTGKAILQFPDGSTFPPRPQEGSPRDQLPPEAPMRQPAVAPRGSQTEFEAMPDESKQWFLDDAKKPPMPLETYIKRFPDADQASYDKYQRIRKEAIDRVEEENMPAEVLQAKRFLQQWFGKDVPENKRALVQAALKILRDYESQQK